MKNVSFALAVVCLGVPPAASSHAEGDAVNTVNSVSSQKASRLNEALRDEISAMAIADQDARKNARVGMPKEAIAEMKRVDDLHEKRMKEIIAQFGWPGISLVGTEGASETWLIVQHCSPAFQEECLPLLERAVNAGEATARDHAYLLDRVRVHQGKPQVYGTQFVDGKPWTLDDPEQVDERRRSVGLGTMAEYTEQMNKLHKRTPVTAYRSPSPLPNAPKLR